MNLDLPSTAATFMRAGFGILMTQAVIGKQLAGATYQWVELTRNLAAPRVDGAHA